MNPWRATLVAALTVLTLSSCGNTSGTTTGTPSLPSPERAITGFDPSSRHINFTFYAINKLALSRPGDVRQAALRHLGDRDPRVRYAAVYALALTATPSQGSTQLVGMLTSARLDERLLAAASLAGTGDKRGLPVLIAALDQSVELSYWSPPQPGFAFAQVWLLNLTDQDFGLKAAKDQASVAATKPAWLQWWASHQATLHFDSKTHRYEA